jgi:radical SAM/Cys-rich protein
MELKTKLTASEQLEILSERRRENYLPFAQKIHQHGLYPLTAEGVEIFQVNIGKMCNQTCRHCHVDAGPDRKEIMTKDTMELCLEVLKKHPSLRTVDITGGAPEMNSNFRWFVEEIARLNRKILVRCNLTIIVANKKYHDLPQFYKEHKVEVISSLPHFNSSRTDAQRGEGVFNKSIAALKMLNDVGYGKEKDLVLNLVYNPSGAFLPASQASLEAEFKKQLSSQYNIVFNNLFTITNLPVSRYLDYLISSENFDTYMGKLASAFNPAAANHVMCRNTISISWDGYLFDCDFNQMLDVKVKDEKRMHLKNFDLNWVNSREIIVNDHCYGCTAGSGSSCGGATV